MLTPNCCIARHGGHPSAGARGRRKKEAGNSGLRHAALTRLSPAALTFAYFLRTYFCDRAPLALLDLGDPTSKFSASGKSHVGCIKLASGPSSKFEILL